MKGRPPCASPPPSSSSSSSEVLRAGELEKRSEGLFQLWKKKQVVLRKESLSLCPSPWSWSEAAGGGKGGGPPRSAAAKELPFDAILKVDCVERTGKYVYFTLVTTDRREIDFRCPGESCWNASIALALIAHQNQRALRDFKSRHQGGAGDEPGRRAPTEGEPTAGGGGQRRT